MLFGYRSDSPDTEDDRFLLFSQNPGMFWCMSMAIFLIAVGKIRAAQIGNVDITREHDWDEATKHILNVRVNESVHDGWKMALLFSKPVARIEMWRADGVGVDKGRTLYTIKNKYFNANLDKGDLLTFALIVYKENVGEKPAELTGVFLPGNMLCWGLGCPQWAHGWPGLPNEIKTGVWSRADRTRKRLQIVTYHLYLPVPTFYPAFHLPTYPTFPPTAAAAAKLPILINVPFWLAEPLTGISCYYWYLTSKSIRLTMFLCWKA